MATRDPETNIDIAPENAWLEYDPFILGPRPIFRGYVSFREGMFMYFLVVWEKEQL